MFRRHRRSLQRSRLTLYGPSAVLLAVALLIAGCGGPPGEDAGLSGQLHEALAASKQGDLVDLSGVFDGDWDRIVLFEGQPTESMAREALGFEWVGQEPDIGDGVTIAIVEGETVTRWAYLPAANDAATGEYVGIQFGPEEGWIVVDPSNTRFEVLIAGGSGFPTTICYPQCS